jgi:hypothetical protein
MRGMERGQYLAFHSSHVIQNGSNPLHKGLTFLLGLKIPTVFPKEDDGTSPFFIHEKLAN